MIKKRIFIGCSTEELDVAKKVESLLNEEFDVHIWNDKKFEGANIFNLNNSFLNDLISTALRFDYGILIGSPDDAIQKDGKTILKARDNVIFELGLCIGRMGLDRVAFLVDSRVSLLTDFMGTSVGKYNHTNHNSLEKEVERIKQKFINHTNRDINFFPSTVLASTYFDSFIVPIVKSFIDETYIECNGTMFNKFKLRIVIPSTLSDDINRQYQMFKKGISTVSKSVKYAGRERNYDIDVTASENELVVIDMPTILSGIKYSLKELMNYSLPESEHKLLLKRELDRFKDTLLHLIDNNLFNDYVEIT